jgi:hypothetical protein
MSSFFKAPITIPSTTSLKFNDHYGNLISIASNISSSTYSLVLPNDIGEIGHNLVISNVDTNTNTATLQFGENIRYCSHSFQSIISIKFHYTKYTGS